MQWRRNRNNNRNSSSSSRRERRRKRVGERPAIDGKAWKWIDPKSISARCLDAPLIRSPASLRRAGDAERGELRVESLGDLQVSRQDLLETTTFVDPPRASSRLCRPMGSPRLASAGSKQTRLATSQRHHRRRRRDSISAEGGRFPPSCCLEYLLFQVKSPTPFFRFWSTTRRATGRLCRAASANLWPDGLGCRSRVVVRYVTAVWLDNGAGVCCHRLFVKMFYRVYPGKRWTIRWSCRHLQTQSPSASC